MRINFDLNNTQDYVASSFTFPPGEYLVEIVSEEENVPLSSGKGTALVFEYQVKEGQFRGQRYRDWINVGHDDAQVRDLARRRLKSIGKAVGLPVYGDTRELHRRPFIIDVTTYTAQNGKERNNIESYRSANSAPQVAAQPVSQPAPQAPSDYYAPQSVPQEPQNAQDAPYWS